MIFDPNIGRSFLNEPSFELYIKFRAFSKRADHNIRISEIVAHFNAELIFLKVYILDLCIQDELHAKRRCLFKQKMIERIAAYSKSAKIERNDGGPAGNC